MGLSTSTKTFAERLEESKKDQFAKAAVAQAQDAQWDKRESARDELGNWQEWRDIAESIRQHPLKYLPHYLTEFSDNVAASGGHVFFAADAKEANDYVKRIILEKNAKKIVKSKSMVSTEVDIDPMLVSLADDMEILETDLAEFILQVADWDEPSHIVFPALHKNRDQIREIFAQKLGYKGDNDPVKLARCARDTMRKLFLKSEVGITGCNFAIANTGHINLSTNEGNADLTISIPKTQIVLMGMERIVPSIKEAEILDNMLARSAVGQKLTTYVTFAGQKAEDESDGPEDFHVVIIDNGRSNAIGKGTSSPAMFGMAMKMAHTGLNMLPKNKEVSVGGSLFKYGAVNKAPALAKGWTDVRDLPIAPPHKEQFRHWYKKHKAGK